VSVIQLPLAVVDNAVVNMYHKLFSCDGICDLSYRSSIDLCAIIVQTPAKVLTIVIHWSSIPVIVKQFINYWQ